MIFLSTSKWPAMVEIAAGEEMVKVRIKVHARARAYRLTLGAGGQAVLTVPSYGKWQEAERFLTGQRAWLAARLRRAPQLVRFEPGAELPLRGEPHTIMATGRLRGQVRCEQDEDGQRRILVPGDVQHLPRRLTEWLKKEALADVKRRVRHHAARLGVKPKNIKIKAQSTRWGSCAMSGNMNFNYKLILTPPFVLDYVAAHEVAHLVEMNHSPAFWAVVEKTLPDMARGRAWLKSHGRQVMAYGE